MDKNAQMLVGMAALALAGLLAFAVYSWRRGRRVRRVDGWVREYLVARYGVLPDRLSINCYGEDVAPVLANFADPRTGVRYHLRFACAGPVSTFALLSEREVER